MKRSAARVLAICSLTVAMGCFGGSALAAARPTFTASPPVHLVANWNQLKQRIAGFGASGAFGQAGYLMFLNPQSQKHILDLLFSKKVGAGLSIVRNLVNDGVDGQTIEPSPGVRNWSITPDDQIWLMKQAMKYGVKTFMSTPWSPPAWMKANDSVVGGPGEKNNYLLPKYYHAYAEYLAAYVNGYWTHFHIKISVISVQNEPNINVKYASCIWTPEQFDTFILQDLIPVFAANHVKAQVMMPEQSYWGEDYALTTLTDPAASNAVSIVAAHGYGGTIAPLPISQLEKKQIWMTEDSTFGPNNPSIVDGIKWAKIINKYLTIANVNSWNYWWLVSNTSDNEGLISLNSFNGHYIVNKRLFTLGNFSRFIRPGFYRIATQSGEYGSVQFSAYRDPVSGKFVIVAINDSAKAQPFLVTLNHLPQLLRGAVIPYTTSASENLQAGPSIALTGNHFEATLPAMSVTSFVGK